MASSENEDNETDKGNLPIPSLLDVLRGLQAGRGAREPPANNSTLESSVHLGDNCSARNDYDPPNNDSDSDSLDGLILSTPVKGSPSTKKAIRKRKGQAKGQRTKQRKRQERDAKADNVAQQAKAQEQLRLDLEKKLDMERQAKEQEERQEALKEREDAMNSVAHLFSQSLTLGDFLSWVFPTDERLEGTNEPGLVGERSLGVSAEWRWTQFFRGPNLRRLLNFWSSARSPMTVRKTMDDFAVQRVIDLVQKEAKSVTESKMLWSQKAEVNEEFVLGFNYQNIHEKLTKELAPVSMQLIHQMATSRRQEKDGISAQRAERKLHRQCISVLCQLGIGCGYTTLTRVSSILSTGQAPTHRLEIAGGGGEEDSCIDNSSGNTGRQRQPESQGCASRHFTSAQRDGQEMTSDMGAISTNASGEAVDSSTTENQSDLPSDCTEGQDGGGLIRKLSQYCRSAAQQLAQSLLYLTVYDNVNMSDKVAEQVLGRKDNPINGTCATVIKLHNASEESLLSSSVDEAFQSAKPLTFEDIDFTESERLVWDKFMLNTFLRIVTTYGGTPLERFQKHVEADTPVSHSKIALHKSEIHPLPALEIDESSITGNIEVLEAITEELGLDATSPDFMRHVSRGS
ncbi:hypothetical protein FRB90_006505 [Tulasnella sp. 427]|nr:hypothetical protein FRB90_006505 [Tulasnella sp. 427]